ncbi:MAG: ATP-binding cassette domain-containing protein [Clostridiaceae bacterium]|nr:ATP-binding cassette domain-containing protein [Clostridiaceae bacterium]
MSNAEDSFIRLDDVTFSYREKIILNKVSLKLKKGDSYAVIGKSGVGKSTLLHLIAGFLKPNAGSIYIDQQEIKSVRKNTAFLFQELGLFPWQKVVQAVGMPLHLNKAGKASEIQNRVLSLLKELDLEHLKNKYPRELSGGEQQRVALARILITNPDLILMDEPTSSLDAMTKEQIQQLILKYQQKLKATMLFITHDIEEAVYLGKHILLLKPGGTFQVIENSFYSVPRAREQLGYYEQCIEIRKLLMDGETI